MKIRSRLKKYRFISEGCKLPSALMAANLFLPDIKTRLQAIQAMCPMKNQQYGPAYNGQLVPIGAPLDSANGTQLMVPYKAYPTSPIKAFFKTGITEQNDISIQQGDDKNSVFFSAQNVYRTTGSAE